MNTLKHLVWVTQLGISLCVPLILCILGAVWLKDSCGLGSWILILGVFLGLGSSFLTGYHYVKNLSSDSSVKSKKQQPPVFNEHD